MRCFVPYTEVLFLPDLGLLLLDTIGTFAIR